MKIFGAKQINRPSSGLDDASADFYRILREDMNRRYLLLLLLAADHELGEKGFVDGLERIRALAQLQVYAEQSNRAESSIQLYSKTDDSELRLPAGMVSRLSVQHNYQFEDGEWL